MNTNDNNSNPYQMYSNYNGAPNNYNVVPNEYDISIGMWILTVLGCSIPFIGLVITIIIACASKNKTQRNWAIANLIIGIISGLFVGFLIITGVFAQMAGYR